MTPQKGPEEKGLCVTISLPRKEAVRRRKEAERQQQERAEVVNSRVECLTQLLSQIKRRMTKQQERTVSEAIVLFRTSSTEAVRRAGRLAENLPSFYD